MLGYTPAKSTVTPELLDMAEQVTGEKEPPVEKEQPEREAESILKRSEKRREGYELAGMEVEGKEALST